MKKNATRHGVRADGKTQTSISLKRELLEAAKAAAEKDSRSLSNWIEILLKEKLEEQKAKESPDPGKSEGAQCPRLMKSSAR